MDEELTPEQKFNAETPETMVPRALMRGASVEEIVAVLVKLEWSRKAATHFIEKVQIDVDRYCASSESRAALVRECRAEFISGLAVAGLSIAATALSAIAALAGLLPIWVLCFGAMLFGFARAHRGYARWRLYRRNLFPDQN